MIAEREYEYEVGERIEVWEVGANEWLPATVTDRFIGPVSGEAVYILDGGDDGVYASELRPVVSA